MVSHCIFTYSIFTIELYSYVCGFYFNILKTLNMSISAIYYLHISVKDRLLLICTLLKGMKFTTSKLR